MALATPNDVRVEIKTSLSDGDIEEVLDRVARDIDREYDSSDFDDDQHRIDFEAVIAAIRIAKGRDRRKSNESIGSRNVTWVGSGIGAALARRNRLDPGTAFSIASGVRRDTDRKIQSAERNDE